MKPPAFLTPAASGSDTHAASGAPAAPAAPAAPPPLGYDQENQERAKLAERWLLERVLTEGMRLYVTGRVTCRGVDCTYLYQYKSTSWDIHGIRLQCSLDNNTCGAPYGGW